jgi:hypothetical protein
VSLAEAKQIGNEFALSFSDEVWGEKVHEAWGLLVSHEHCSSREWTLTLLVETLHTRADFEETKRNHKNIASGFRKAADMLSKNNSSFDELNAVWRVFTKACNLEPHKQ